MKKVMYVEGHMVEFEIYPLIDSYDPRLRVPTTPVDFDTVNREDLAGKVLSLMKTVEHYEGLGLSANQCGLSERICVINHLAEKRIHTLINPVVVERSIETSRYKEGCLSFPGLFLEIGRPEWCVVEYQSAAGEAEKVRTKFTGIWATCVQHEIDHLDGICYTDKVSPIKLDMAKRKVKANLRKIRRVTTGA